MAVEPNPIPFPPDYKAIVSFDTSVPNRLVKDGKASESVIARIRDKRRVRLTGLSIEEMLSTPSGSVRGDLFDSYETLIHVDNGNSDCLMTHNLLLETLVLEHYRNPRTFDWGSVDVRSHRFYEEIFRREHLMDDALAAEQKKDIADLRKAHREVHRGIRETLEPLFAANGQARPLTFRDAMTLLEGGKRKASITLGKRFYDGVTKGSISRESIREFIEICPPFRAMIYATLMSEYDLAICDQKRAERYRAGCLDLYMAVYLPYCDEFVTDEKGKEQERCLREVASVARIHTMVLSYDDFCLRLQGSQP
jgi:hypothetical protein